MIDEPTTAGGTAPESRSRPGRLLLVGARRQLRSLAGCLEHPAVCGLPIVGFVDLTGRGRQLVVHPGSAPVPVLGRIDNLEELIKRTGATDLLVALTDRPAGRLQRSLEALDGGSVRVHWAHEKQAVHEGGAGAVGPRPRRPGPPPGPLFWGRLAKRVLDVVGALAGLIVLAPLLVGISLAILITSGRPVFYTQQRVGRGGRLFPIIKFRSMRVDAEDATGPIWASDGDDRCTRIGAWLRRTNLDELPQLWNVLLGHMSLVGPRPERPVFVEQFRAVLPRYDDRHAVPVGMTGWAQVHGWRGRTSLRKRLQYDLDYIRRWSFGLDLKILLMTVQHVACGKTVWSRPTAPARRAAPAKR